MSKAAAFWDASALVTLCVEEAATNQVRRHLRRLSLVVWWGSMVEVHSAIARLHRDAAITPAERDGALARLALLSQGWSEILPDDALRKLAGTLLDTYALRVADSLQLASALTWCQQYPRESTFVCGDRRLSDAARSAGFAVAELSQGTR